MTENGKRQGIAVFGNALVDKINVVERYPACGELAKIRTTSVSLGGAVPNVAIDLKRICPSLPVFAGGRVGKDEDGALIRRTLEGEGVDTAALLVDEAHGTSFTQVMSIEGGQRTFFTYAGASAAFGAEDVDLDALPAAILHLGYFLLLDKIDAGDGELLLREAQKRGILTSIDLVSESSERYKDVLRCLPYTDYLIVNEYEAGQLAGIEPTNENLEKICRRLRELGVGRGVIIHKPDASVILCESGFTALGSFELPEGFIQGTTGAGDAFCAGALFAIAEGYGDREILEIASCAAAVSLRAQGATEALCSLEEMKKICQNFERKQLCL